jgi:hypothetical protein
MPFGQRPATMGPTLEAGLYYPSSMVLLRPIFSLTRRIYAMTAHTGTQSRYLLTCRLASALAG